MLSQKQKVGLLARSIISLQSKADEMPNREGNRQLIAELYQDLEQLKQWLAEIAESDVKQR